MRWCPCTLRTSIAQNAVDSSIVPSAVCKTPSAAKDFSQLRTYFLAASHEFLTPCDNSYILPLTLTKGLRFNAETFQKNGPGLGKERAGWCGQHHPVFATGGAHARGAIGRKGQHHSDTTAACSRTRQRTASVTVTGRLTTPSCRCLDAASGYSSQPPLADERDDRRDL